MITEKILENNNQITFYLSNWLYNSGLLGLYRILEFAKINFTLTEYSLTINTKDLKEISIAFFEFYIKKYLIEKLPEEIKNNLSRSIKSKNKININLKEIKSIIINFLENTINYTPNIQEYLENIENSLKDIENLIIKQLADKFSDNTSIDNILQKLKIKEIISEEIEKIKNFNLLGYFQGFYFNKSILASPSNQKLPLNQKLEKFYQEYIKDITYSQNNFNLDKYYTCVICNNKYQSREFLNEFIETDFSILGISSTEFLNYYYYYKDKNKHYNLKCKVCEFILLCSFAGFTQKEDKDSTKTSYIFLSAPFLTDIIQFNQNLQNKNFINILDKLIQQSTIIEKINYYINNIYIIELNPGRKYEKAHKFTFFYLNPILIELYLENTNLIKSLIEEININIKYQNETINLANETIRNLSYQKNSITLIINLIKQYLLKEFYNIKAIRSLIYLNFLITVKIIEKNKKEKRGEDIMDSNKIFGIIKSIERDAAQSFSESEINSTKRSSIAFRFLNLIKGNKKEDFYNELLRLYIVYNKPIPESVRNILYESDYISFQEKALAFITGFITPLSTQKQIETKTIENYE
jgi:CRISPR-associated protein Cst1